MSIAPAYDLAKIRADFPVLSRMVHGDKPLVYLDNAATSQKPQAVIDALADYYSRYNSNVHRGVHALSEEATKAYEGSRERVAKFLGASADEIVFTRGTTEAINLVAQAWARNTLKTGDEIIISHIEHHSNIVPWQLLEKQVGVVVRVIPVLDSGELDQAAYRSMLNEKTRLLAIAHVSNALGTVNPIEQMIQQAKAVGALVLVDGAQATPHLPVDVKKLDADFYAFSGHKVYGPTGIGALYIRKALLDEMPPWQGGGEMIKVVSFDGSTFNEGPHKFEAGTPNIADAIALTAALDYLDNIGLENIAAWEHDLLSYATATLKELPNVRLVGEAKNKAGILSFVFDDVHASDLGALVDRFGVAIRVGHHCAMPAMQRFGLSSTARASFALYNTTAEVDAFIDALTRARAMLL